MPTKPFKIVILTDIHIGADKPHDGQTRKLSSQARSLLKYMVTRINNEIEPEFVVQLGDLIEDEDEDNDVENFCTAVDILKNLTMPVYHVVGNREQVNLGLEQISSILNYPKLHYSFDSGDFHFVVLCATSKNNTDIHIDAPQRNWLAEDLNATTKPTIVFTHHPIDEQDLTGNFWFENKPEHCFVEESWEIRETLVRSHKVRAVFNGHVHRNNLESQEGVCFVTLQSLVENLSDTRKVASESFAIVTLSASEIRVEIEGMDRAEYVIVSSPKLVSGRSVAKVRTVPGDQA